MANHEIEPTTEVLPEAAQPHGELQERLQGRLDSLLELYDGVAAGYQPAREAANEYTARRHDIAVPNNTVIKDPNVALVAKIVSLMAQTKMTGKETWRSPDALSEDAQAQVDSYIVLAGAASEYARRRPWDREARTQFGGMGLDQRQVEEVLQVVTVAALGGPMPLYEYSGADARDVLSPFEALNDLKNPDDLMRLMPQMAELIRALPPGGTSDYLVLSAYADAIRAYRRTQYEASSDMGRSVPDALDVPDLALGGALELIGMGAVNIKPTDEAGEKARMAQLAKRLGMDAPDQPSVLSGSQTSREARETLRLHSDRAEHLANAYDTLYALQTVRTGRTWVAWLITEEGPVGLDRAVRTTCAEQLPAPLEQYALTVEAELRASIDLDTVGNTDVATILSTIDMLQTEQNLLDLAHDRLATYAEAGMIDEATQAQLAARLEPRLRRAVQERLEVAQLERLQEYITNAQMRIADIEKDYAYNSRKIHSLQGTSLPRDLGNELQRYRQRAQGGREVLREVRDEQIEKMLAIVILQARQAPDAGTYFDRLFDSRYEIEQQRVGLARLGVVDEGKSMLIDVLQLVDELTDTDLTRINNSSLKDFLRTYTRERNKRIAAFRAAEAEQTMLEEASTPVIEPPIEGTRAARNDELQDLYDHPPSPEFVQQYFGDSLEGVIDTLDITRVNMVVFPESHSSTSQRRGKAPDPEHERTVRILEIDPQRLVGLGHLQQRFRTQGLEAELMVTDPPRPGELPHFVLHVRDPQNGKGVCFIENLASRWATYRHPVDGQDVREWDDVISVAETREQARQLGATRSHHPARDSSRFMAHYDSLFDYGQQELARLSRL